MSKKNSYENTEETYKGGIKYGSDIHGVAIRVNQIMWDMIKVLDKKELFGFHFKAKISTNKTIIIMTHKEQEMIDKAKKALKEFNHIPDTLFIGKVKEERKKSLLLKIFFIISIIGLLLFLLFEVGLYFYNKSSFSYQERREQKSSIETNSSMVVKLDIKKLKAIQESFDKSNEPIKPEIMSALDVTTAIISDMVPPSQKEKYSSEDLVKNFHGKAGIKFELDDTNMSSKDFNSTVKELNDYAMSFIKDKNLSNAIKCYDKILAKKQGVREEDKAQALSQKANIDRLMGDLNSSQEEYQKSLELTKELVNSNPQKFTATEAFNLAKLSKVQKDLNISKLAQENLKLANQKYSNGLDRFKKLYKKNPSKYREDLAWNYNIMANFYLDDWEDLNKSIEYRKEALKLYKKLYKRDKKLFTLTLFKTYNSLAKTYIKMDNIELAKRSYIDGFNLIKKSRYRGYLALSYHNLGSLYAKNREFKRAKISYNQALKIYESLGKKRYIDELLELNYNIASLHSYMGDFKRAKEEYKRVIDSYKKLKREHKYANGIAKTQNALSWIYISQAKYKNYIKAKELLNSSLKLIRNREYGSILAQTYSYLAHLYSLEGKIDNSMEYYKKSLNLKRDFQTDRRYTTLLIFQKKYLEALRNFELMLEIYKKESQKAKILSDYGEFYLSLDRNIAKEKLNKALKIYNRLSKNGSDYKLEINNIEAILKF